MLTGFSGITSFSSGSAQPPFRIARRTFPGGNNLEEYADSRSF
jgi:hypothetical protein